MNQTRLQSLTETVLSTAIGFGVALLAQRAIFPVFGFHPPLHENIAIAMFFTVVSLVRGYLVRRFCNAYLHRLAAAVARRFAREAPPWRVATTDDLRRLVRFVAGYGIVWDASLGRQSVFIVYVPRDAIHSMRNSAHYTMPYTSYLRVRALPGWRLLHALRGVRVVSSCPFEGDL